MLGFWGASGISWTLCKQLALCSRQITTPAPHHSIFTGRMLLLTPNQQCQSTEGSEEGIKITPSVPACRPFASTLTFNRLTFAYHMFMGHDHSSLQIE